MKVLERKIYREILGWKNTLADKYALLLEGARRVGKTHIIRSFVQAEYATSIFIDFSEQDRRAREVRRAFEDYSDIPDLLSQLQLIFNVKLHPGRSCVVFDEVQLYPPARQLIKQLVEYGRYHYIETGSLVGIHENVKDILIPSEEHGIKMYPLDFEEFLDALEDSMLKEHVQDCFQRGTGVSESCHDKLIALFRLYIVVGGMPQSVLAYLGGDAESRLEASERAKREILKLYDADIGKYAKGYASKVRSIFQTIPSALRRHEKKFHLSDLGSNARFRRYENAFLWLKDAMVANVAYNSLSPDLGLGMNLDSSSFKCYYGDTGLLVTRAMGNGKSVDPRIMRGILHDSLGIDEGMFFENVVAQTFAAKGDELRFYSRKDRVDESNTMEIDFLLGRGIKTVPVEVKSGRYRAHASLDRMIGKFNRHLGAKYVVCEGRYERDGEIVYLPSYMVHLI